MIDEPKYARSYWGWPPSTHRERETWEREPIHAAPTYPAAEHVASLADLRVTHLDGRENDD